MLVPIKDVLDVELNSLLNRAIFDKFCRVLNLCPASIFRTSSRLLKNSDKNEEIKWIAFGISFLIVSNSFHCDTVVE